MRDSNVDDRIVQMRLDNSNFERNAKQSLSTLEKLDRSINDLGENYSNETFSKMADALELISDRFTTLGIVGVRVLENITDAAFATGQRLLKAFTVDNVSDGFAKYESLIESVQKIMNATGLSIDTVSEKVNEFRWFSDETSYSLEDMVRYLGQFTSSGVAVDDAKASILGLATASGLYGVSAEMATHAMQGFSKAIANGKMSTNEWRWIQTASLNTTGFKQELIEAAVAEGLLTEAGEGVWRTTKGTTVSVAQFEQTLHDGWLTTKAMSRALSKYGSTAEEIYKIHGETGKSAWEILQEEGLIEEGLGKQAFEASQIAKTWRDVLKSVKDAVSSGWAKTFELLIGDFEEATEFWGVVAEELYNLFAEGGNIRNDILQIWHDAGGRDDLLAAAQVIWEEFVNLLNLIKQAWRDIFGTFGPTEEDIAEVCELLGIDATEALELVGDETSRAAIGIWMFTKRIRKFFESIRPSEETLDKLSRIFKGIFSFLDILRIGFGAIWDILSAFFPTLKGLGSGFLEIVANIADYISGVRDSLRESDSFASGVENVVTWIQTAISNVREFFASFSLEHLWEQLKSWFSKISEFFWKFFTNPFSTSNGSFVETIEELFGFGGSGLLAYGFYRLLNFGKNVVGGITGILDSIGEAVGSFEKQAKTSNMLRIAASIGILAVSLMLLASIDADRLHQASLALTGLFAALVSAATIYSNADSILNTLFGAKGFLFGNTAKGLKGLFGTGSKFTSLIKLAAAVLILALSLKAIASIDTEKLMPSFIALAGIMGLLVAIAAILSSDKIGFKGKGVGKLIFVALAVAILASVAKSLSKLTLPEFIKGIGGLIAVVLSIGILTEILGNDEQTFKGKGIGKLIFVALAVAILAGVAKNLSKLTIPELLKGIGGLIAVVFSIGILTAILGGDKKTFKGKGVGKLIFVALAVAILAGVAKNLSKLTIPELLKGIGGLIAIVFSIGILTGILGSDEQTFKGKGVGKLIFVALAVAILAGVAKNLSKLSIPELAKGIGGLVGIVISIAILTAILGGDKKTFKGKGVGKLIFVALAVAILAGVAKNLSKLTIPELLKGIGGLIAIVFSIGILTGILGSDEQTFKGKGVGKLIFVALAVAILAGVAKNLSKLSIPELAKGIGGLVGVAAVLLGFSYLISKLNNSKNNTVKIKSLVQYIVIAATMSIVARSLSRLARYDWKHLIGAAASISACLLAISGAIRLISKDRGMAFDKSNYGMIILSLASIMAIGYVLIQLSGQKWSSLLAAAASISGCLIAIAGAIRIVKKVKVNSAVAILIGYAACVGAMIGIAYALNQLKDYDAVDLLKKAGIMAGSIFAMALVLALLGKIGPNILSSVSVLIGLASCIAAIIGIAYALNQLKDYDANDLFKKAAIMLGSILALGLIIAALGLIGPATIALGALSLAIIVGAVALIVWGLTELGSSIVDSAISMAEKLETFMNSLQPFINSITMLDSSLSDDFALFAGIMLELFKAEFWMALSELLSRITGDAFTFGDKASRLLEDLQPFLTMVTGITAAHIAGVTMFRGFMKLLIGAEFWTTIAQWISYLTGDVLNLGQKMTRFLEDLQPFLTMVTGITATHIAGITMFRGFMKLLTGAEFWTTIAQWISDLTGDVLQLGRKMSRFIEDLQPFFGYLLALNPEINGKIITFNTLLRRMVSTSLWATIGDWVSGWTDSYSGFPAKMSSFITELDPFLTELEKIDDSTLSKVNTFNTMISTLVTESIWSGLKSWISSWFSEDYNKFAEKVSNFASGLTPFLSLMSTYSTDAFSNAESLGTSLQALNDGFVLGDFGQQLGIFNSYVQGLEYDGDMAKSITFLNDLTAAVTGVMALDFGSFTAFIDWYNSIVNKLNGLPNITTLIFEETGKSAGQGFADGLRSKEAEVQNAATFIIGVALTAIMTALQIHSPSRVLENIGALGGAGLAEGFINSENVVSQAATFMANSAISPIASLLDYISAATNDDMSIEPLITPVMDMSKVYAANDQMDDLFANTRSYSAKISQDIVSSSRPVPSNSAESNRPSAGGVSEASIYVNVYGAEGQNINDLANAVVEKISWRLDRRGVSFG